MLTLALTLTNNKSILFHPASPLDLDSQNFRSMHGAINLGQFATSSHPQHANQSL